MQYVLIQLPTVSLCRSDVNSIRSAITTDQKQRPCLGEFYCHKSRAHIFNLKTEFYVFVIKTCNACTQNVCSLSIFSVPSQIFVLMLRFFPLVQNFSLHGLNLRLQISLSKQKSTIAMATFHSTEWKCYTVQWEPPQGCASFFIIIDIIIIWE